MPLIFWGLIIGGGALIATRAERTIDATTRLLLLVGGGLYAAHQLGAFKALKG